MGNKIDLKQCILPVSVISGLFALYGITSKPKITKDMEDKLHFLKYSRKFPRLFVLLQEIYMENGIHKKLRLYFLNMVERMCRMITIVNTVDSDTYNEVKTIPAALNRDITNLIKLIVHIEKSFSDMGYLHQLEFFGDNCREITAFLDDEMHNVMMTV